jgi:hypothetical protein
VDEVLEEKKAQQPPGSYAGTESAVAVAAAVGLGRYLLISLRTSHAVLAVTVGPSAIGSAIAALFLCDTVLRDTGDYNPGSMSTKCT